MATFMSAAERPPLPGDQARHRRQYKDALACEDCRRRKRKCDGARPICGTCAKRKATVPCIYTSRRGTDESNSRYVQQLLERISHLESNFNPIGEPNFPQRPSGNPHQAPFEQAWVKPNEHPQQAPPIHGPASIPDSHSQTAIISDYPVALPLSPTGDAEDSDNNEFPINGRVDAMGACSGDANDEVVGNAPEGRVYFGISSTLSFMNQVQNVLDMSVENPLGEEPDSEITESPTLFDLSSESHSSHRGQTSPVLHANGLRQIRSRRRVRSQSKYDVFSLPSRQDANDLVASYWKWVHCLYPFLNREAFDGRYEELWSPSSRDPLAHQFAQYQAQYPSMKSRETQIRLFKRAVRSENVLFHCIVNLVFALGSQFHSDIDPAERGIHGDAFYQRAKRLLELDFNIMAHGCVQLVQTFLLMSQYIQTSEMSGGCWNCVATATRAAQTIGLHLDAQLPSRSELPLDRKKENEINLRRRLWGGCVFFDRILAMTYGRPSMVESNLSAKWSAAFSALSNEPAPSQVETDAANLCNSADYLAFYFQTLKHAEILKMIVSTFYREADGSSLPLDRSQQPGEPGADSFAGHKQTRKLTPADVQALLELEDSLRAWQEQLPDHLRVASSPDKQLHVATTRPVNSEIMKVYARQANVLQARYLHSRIMLFRPALLQLCALSQSKARGHETEEVRMSELQHVVVVQAATMCISAAHDLTDLIYYHKGLDNEVLPEWWYNVFYIYTCATALLAAQLCMHAFELLGSVPLRQSWEKCLESLKMYQVRSVSAQRCLRVLELIDQRLRTRRAGLSSQSAAGSARQSAANHAGSDAGANNTRRHDHATGNRDVERGAMPDMIPTTSVNISNQHQHLVPGMSAEHMDMSMNLSPDLGIGMNEIVADWMQSPLDLEWLTSAPFEMEFDGPIADVFVG
ncbi:uncharacterized protein Z520_11679 [Fonsecaea multimorphosa CBS 102226]|uniref:Zn(2)-C6 fungal-type domain-containing protein n=1 Tax=Fonsecaea multimorphosa CBS 102226 TaxID=1442371 RepID=A0A0D2GT44_9EURO|nr:uncharacterized protein Z520_11679 [Fonsecaea multimorphosa CBS 102226]KIX92650.1 hypothetical protein Z520_11679 [Fonsecaea multimorphosa CBS 102226]OAL17874.1 hypothetical protein AYO22_11218 [Fonsecaea multimorphosa]